MKQIKGPRWALLLAVLLLFVDVNPVLAAPYTVYIDPGHGAIDSGAIGPAGTLEKDINLAVALKTAKLLKQYNELSVCMTRASDSVSWSQSTTANDLQGRCDLANNIPADIFVSLHCDSYTNPEAKGTTAYCYQFGGQGEKLARSIHSEMLKIPSVTDSGTLSANNMLTARYGSHFEDFKLPDHGLKEANFYVLRYTDMPASLLEMSFISNPLEEMMLNTQEFQDQAAQAIATGILNYFNIDPQKSYNINPAVIYSGSTYVPLASFLSALGLGQVTGWDANTSTVTFVVNGIEYTITIGNGQIKEV